jgi:hypothetical protein
MYIINADDYILYDPRVEDLTILSASLPQEANKSSVLTFSMPKSHPLYNSLTKLKTSIEVFKDNKSVFYGRILDIDTAFNGTKTITCEDALSFLNDSVVRPYVWGTGGVGSGGPVDYLRYIVNQHNGQVETNRQFQVRTVTVTDPNNFIRRSSNTYPSTWSDLLSSTAGSSLGGYLMYEHDGNNLYLDYYADSPFKSTQVIRLSDNITDLKITENGDTIATALVPLGAKIAVDGSTSDEDSPRLSVASVNGGRDYVFDQLAVNEYGWISRTVVYDDITVADNLLARSKEDLKSAVLTQMSIDITAVDLNYTDSTIDQFSFMDYVDVESNAHGVEGKYLINKATTDLLNVANNKIQIGRNFGTLSGSSQSLGATVNNINTNYATRSNINTLNDKINAIGGGMSYQEQDTGTFYTDGRKIYKKTISIGVVQVGIDKRLRHGVSNINKVIRSEGWIFSSAQAPDPDYPYNIGAFSNLPYSELLVNSPTSFTIFNAYIWVDFVWVEIRAATNNVDWQGWAIADDSAVTIYYTKTT